MKTEQIKKMADGSPPSEIGKDFEEVIIWLAENYIALQEQMQKLAAEVESVREQSEEVYAAGYNHGHLNSVDGIAYEPGTKDEFYQNALQVMAEVETPATDEFIREAGAKAVEDSDDKKRMDWLCSHSVEVRKPQMYGSHAMFHAQEDSEEWDLPHHTTLREQVDAAISAGEQP